jgi:hypothetical protein
MLHNLFYFPQNAIYFIILSFYFQIILFHKPGAKLYILTWSFKSETDEQQTSFKSSSKHKTQTYQHMRAVHMKLVHSTARKFFQSQVIAHIIKHKLADI